MAELRQWFFVHLLLCATGKDGPAVLPETEAAPGAKPSLCSPMTAALGQQLPVFLLNEKGDDVPLPCGNVNMCDQIRWWLKPPGSPLYMPLLVPPPGSTLSSMKMLQEGCTLVLLQVQARDAGQYACRLGLVELAQFYVEVVTSEYQSRSVGAAEPC